MVFNKTEEQEKEYLRQITTRINDSINQHGQTVKEHVGHVTRVQRISVVE